MAYPLAHFWFCHLIFGVSSVSELFPSKMQQILAGCEGGFIHLDDSRILAASQKGHDRCRQAADIVLATYDVILCNGKCRSSVSSLIILLLLSIIYIRQSQQIEVFLLGALDDYEDA